MFVSPSLGAFVGIFSTLVALGFVVQRLCLPSRYHTWGWWMTVSFIGLPLVFLGVTLIAAYPPLLLVALIGVGGVIHWRRHRKSRH